MPKLPPHWPIWVTLFSAHLASNQFSIALVKGYSTDLLVEIIKGIKDDIFAKVALKLGEGGPVCLLIGDWSCFLLVIW